MNRGQAFESRKNFIEKGIGALMSVKRDYAYIKYARASLTESEYIRIGDVFGKAITIDITAKSLEEIFEDVSRINLIGKEKIAPPSNIVTDNETLRKIAPLFMQV